MENIFQIEDMAYTPILQAALKYKPRVFLLGTCSIWYTVGLNEAAYQTTYEKNGVHHTGIISVTALSKIMESMAAHNISEFQSTQGTTR